MTAVTNGRGIARLTLVPRPADGGAFGNASVPATASTAPTSRRLTGQVSEWPERLGPDGTPLMDDPVIAAERSSRLADDLAAMVERVLTQLEWQASALDAVAPADVYSRKHRDDARRANGRVALALKVVRDGLGEQHVATDMLADQLHRLFPFAPTTQVPDDADDVTSGASSPVAG